MKTQNLIGQVNSLLQHKRVLLFLVMFSLPLNIILSLCVLKQIGEERILVVPPIVKRAMWMEVNTVSESALELWADYFSQLVLNITPANVSLKHELLLSYVHEKNYAKIKAGVSQQQDFIKKHAVSTFFSVTNFQPILGKQQVILHGNLRIIHGETVQQNVSKVFIIAFSFQNGKPLIKKFEDITNA